LLAGIRRARERFGSRMPLPSFEVERAGKFAAGPKNAAR